MVLFRQPKSRTALALGSLFGVGGQAATAGDRRVEALLRRNPSRAADRVRGSLRRNAVQTRGREGLDLDDGGRDVHVLHDQTHTGGVGADRAARPSIRRCRHHGSLRGIQRLQRLPPSLLGAPQARLPKPDRCGWRRSDQRPPADGVAEGNVPPLAPLSHIIHASVSGRCFRVRCGWGDWWGAWMSGSVRRFPPPYPGLFTTENMEMHSRKAESGVAINEFTRTHQTLCKSVPCHNAFLSVSFRGSL